MPKLFDEMGDPISSWRALQIWQILVGRAHNQQIMTYGQLADMIGYQGPSGLNHSLGRIMAYCHQENLPPLTTIVVNRDTGLPGPGLATADDYDTISQAQIRVFEEEWYKIIPPTAEEFYQAFEDYQNSQ